MIDEDAALAETAMSLNEDAKAGRKKKTKEDESVLETNAGLHEEEVTTALGRMGAIVDETPFDPETLQGDVRDCIIDIIKSRPKPWSAMSAAEQQDVVRTVEYSAKALVGKAVDAIMSAGKSDPVKAILESYAEKDGIKVTLKVKTMTEDESLAAVQSLHSARGKMVLLTKASAEDYSGQRGDTPIDPDQTGFEFEGGDDLGGDDGNED